MANGVLFGYISSASFVLQSDFGLSELTFGIVFGVNSLAIGAGSVFSVKLKRISSALTIGCIGMVVCSLLQFANLYMGGGIISYEMFTFILLLSVGMVFTSTTTLAMTEGKSMIGWASAIVGATGFLFGGIVTPLVGLGNIQLSTYTVLTICSISAIICLICRRN